jgi:hypothetical protein
MLRATERGQSRDGTSIRFLLEMHGITGCCQQGCVAFVMSVTVRGMRLHNKA